MTNVPCKRSGVDLLQETKTVCGCPHVPLRPIYSYNGQDNRRNEYSTASRDGVDVISQSDRVKDKCTKMTEYKPDLDLKWILPLKCSP